MNREAFTRGYMYKESAGGEQEAASTANDNQSWAKEHLAKVRAARAEADKRGWARTMEQRRKSGSSAPLPTNEHQSWADDHLDKVRAARASNRKRGLEIAAEQRRKVMQDKYLNDPQHRQAIQQFKDAHKKWLAGGMVGTRPTITRIDGRTVFTPATSESSPSEVAQFEQELSSPDNAYAPTTSPAPVNQPKQSTTAINPLLKTHPVMSSTQRDAIEASKKRALSRPKPVVDPRVTSIDKQISNIKNRSTSFDNKRTAYNNKINNTMSTVKQPNYTVRNHTFKEPARNTYAGNSTVKPTGSFNRSKVGFAYNNNAFNNVSRNRKTNGLSTSSI